MRILERETESGTFKSECKKAVHLIANRTVHVGTASRNGRLGIESLTQHTVRRLSVRRSELDESGSASLSYGIAIRSGYVVVTAWQ